MNAYKSQNSYRYNTGSNAYAEERDLQVHKRNKEQQKRSRRNLIELQKRKQREDRILFMKMGAYGIILFVACFSFVGLTSELSMKQKELQKINMESREVQSKISSCQAFISQYLNLEDIKVKAELIGLREPLPHQVVYIQIPKVSYTVYSDTQPID